MFLAIDVGVDLGTSNTRIFLRDKGIVIDEPSVVAINRELGKVVACGYKAKEMMGRVPSNIEVIEPLCNGVIADIDGAEKMLTGFFRRALSKAGILDQVRVLIGVPHLITPVHERAFKECCMNSGASDVVLVKEHQLAAIGLGMEIGDVAGQMLVDMGGGKTEITVFSKGDVAHCLSLPVGGEKFIDNIIDHVRNKYKVVIGRNTAENLLVNIGSAYLPHLKEKNRYYEIGGKNLVTGMPKVFSVHPEDVHIPINDCIREIVEGIKQVISQCSPEVNVDLADKGILLSGGLAELNGIGYVISRYTGLPVNVGYEPLFAVVRGAGRQLTKLDKIKRKVSPFRRPKRRG